MKSYPNFSKRVRFNWGFHDATAEYSRGRPRTREELENHFDRVYVLGYRYGLESIKTKGVRVASSESAWENAKELWRVTDNRVHA